MLFARRCRLAVEDKKWLFSAANEDAIDALWAERTASNPRLFNGRIHLVTHFAIGDDETFSARFLATDFKSYLLWREQGFVDTTVSDGFGSALLRSAEGHILLGRQTDGYINAGLSYLPGGFIDPRDVTPEGTIDIEASIARELREETGLAQSDLERVPGFHLTLTGPLISIAAEYRSPLPSHELKSKIEAYIAQDSDPELAGMTVVKSMDDIETMRMAPYAQVLLKGLFQA